MFTDINNIGALFPHAHRNTLNPLSSPVIVLLRLNMGHFFYIFLVFLVTVCLACVGGPKVDPPGAAASGDESVDGGPLFVPQGQESVGIDDQMGSDGTAGSMDASIFNSQEESSDMDATELDDDAGTEVEDDAGF